MESAEQGGDLEALLEKFDAQLTAWIRRKDIKTRNVNATHNSIEKNGGKLHQAEYSEAGYPSLEVNTKKKFYRQIKHNKFLFSLNNRPGVTIIFNGEKEREEFVSTSRWLQRVKEKGGTSNMSRFIFDFQNLYDLMPTYLNQSYTNKSEAYKNMFETYKTNHTLDWEEVKGLGFGEKCKGKDKTFKCYSHIHELAMLLEMVEYDQTKGQTNIYTKQKLTLQIEGMCQNHLSSMAVMKTKELIVSLSEEKIGNMTTLDDEDTGGETDSGFTELEEESLGRSTNISPTNEDEDGELWDDADEDDQTAFLSSEHQEASIITIDPDIITIT